MDLTGKVALITGGTRGIGYGIAERLAAHGATVALVARSPEKGAEALQRLNAEGRAFFYACDVLERDSVEETVDAVIEQNGGVDILVNNAGGADGFALIHEMTDEAWQKAGTWILDQVFWFTRRCLPHMVDQRWGRIVNISSIASKQAKKPGSSHYITFKHALNGFSKATARDYGELGITCNAICPGPVETDLMREAGRASAARRGVSYEDYLKNYAADTMTKQLNTVEQVAATCALLVSDEGAGITGTAINVDGGTLPW
ncbi:SDR family NAD(P)-dependent oxidoreductase [Mycolicibacterium thermoresistibile]|uniref:3-oxoacyl-[acyl-carrier-protein] reductase MabA n=2 Tax=Mycolicibacterium thermoresistibile TaxID=1797 RepID=G7CB31_MYCT3|nr:SDR family NAD(P)-dependent oxidoreductase [Mycolicibacterium thermoresistibile]EHI14813.1 3-oxoacyl-[acyl-carrier-protein] reductase [Mycolicibacterium thermoresistibile ATCC 19527]GAT16241.1 3-oxoacyl-[acyl-carrier-protein] reductase [Mycolicibacterium thermoresistibile]SNW16988.1 dehydrogenase of uncharacterised specificity, short-chain alcohol dehydrogenase like protein [Mycolicibacterium thermoresistibile]